MNVFLFLPSMQQLQAKEASPSEVNLRTNGYASSIFEVTIACAADVGIFVYKGSRDGVCGFAADRRPYAMIAMLS